METKIMKNSKIIQEEISRVILELQKVRYFETLTSRFWNSNLRGQCPIVDDSEGITLTSLSGVFISTSIGLVIAMIVLGFEVKFWRLQMTITQWYSLLTLIKNTGLTKVSLMGMIFSINSNYTQWHYQWTIPRFFLLICKTTIVFLGTIRTNKKKN